MNTLKTTQSLLAALLLLCPTVRAQDNPLTKIFSKAAEKATGAANGKPPAKKTPSPAKPTETAKTPPPTKTAEPAKTLPPAKTTEVTKTPPPTKTAEPARTTSDETRTEHPPIRRVEETRVVKPIQPKDVKLEHRPNGIEISRRQDGKPRDLHVVNHNGAPMDIHHDLRGGRRVEVARPDGSRIVAEGGHRGYVERPYTYRGHEFAHRTYFVNGRAYDRFYGRYGYRGSFLEVYAPARYYPGAFYGWAYNTQWAAVPYGWAWAGNPWFAYYGAYFTPYPLYANASFWLTDYLISKSLAGAYQAAVDAQIALNQPLQPGQVVLTPDVKQAIEQEVQRQIAVESNEAQANSQNADFNPQFSGIAGALADNGKHAFVVGGALDLVDTTGLECAVTEGDVLQFDPAVPQADGAATLIVMASKGGMECRRGLPVTVSYVDLQGMQNHMRETVDAGLTELQAHQNGLPTPPQSANAPATPAGFESGAPGPDPAAGAQIEQQYQDAGKAEQETLSPGAGSAATPADASQPPAISIGMPVDQVISIMGQPKVMADKGSQKIYVYDRMKITFTDGKVSDIE